MSAADLLALADRVEREPPSRELCADIARALGWTNVKQETDWGRTDYVGDAPGGASFGCWLPDWLRSLDAAVTLVPANVEWWEVYYERDWKRGPARAQLVISDGLVTAFAATPAAALTAAALRALAGGHRG